MTLEGKRLTGVESRRGKRLRETNAEESRNGRATRSYLSKFPGLLAGQKADLVIFGVFGAISLPSDRSSPVPLYRLGGPVPRNVELNPKYCRLHVPCANVITFVRRLKIVGNERYARDRGKLSPG